MHVSEFRSSLTERLAKHLCGPVPTNVRAKVRLHLLDWLACVAGARQSEVAGAIREAEPDVLIRAAFLGNVLEMDDVHRSALLHPGPVVWPSVLAAARDEGVEMDALLGAAVMGYQAMIAIGETLDAHHYSLWHNSATAGGFGAIGAVSSIYGLNEAQITAAFGNIGSITGGLWHQRHAPGMTKQLHIAHAVRTGIWVARLARDGLTGSSAILEGPQGFYAATTTHPRTLRLGEDWRIDQVSLKPWAACRHAHPAIDAALRLREQGALHGPVEIEAYGDAISFCDRANPVSVLEAKFSLQHSVAIVALRGEPALEDYQPDAIGDPAVAALRQTVSVREAADITARYPAHFGVRITAGGRTVELIDTLGDPECPLSSGDVMAKARALIAWGGLAPTEAERAIHLAMEWEGNTGAIVNLLEDWL